MASVHLLRSHFILYFYAFISKTLLFHYMIKETFFKLLKTQSLQITTIYHLLPLFTCFFLSHKFYYFPFLFLSRGPYGPRPLVELLFYFLILCIYFKNTVISLHDQRGVLQVVKNSESTNYHYLPLLATFCLAISDYILPLFTI